MPLKYLCNDISFLLFHLDYFSKIGKEDSVYSNRWTSISDFYKNTALRRKFLSYASLSYNDEPFMTGVNISYCYIMVFAYFHNFRRFCRDLWWAWLSYLSLFWGLTAQNADIIIQLIFTVWFVSCRSHEFWTVYDMGVL